MHRIYRVVFTAAQRTRKTAIRLLISATVFWRYWAGSGKNLRQGSITATPRCCTRMIWRTGCATGTRKTARLTHRSGDNIFRMLGKNGYRWVSSAANRVEWRGDGYIVGTITDITPYMELREKLEQQNRTQREALETANRNLLRMMQQMEEQKTQFAQTTARNMEKEERYRQRLNHDALTGTYNRRYYEDVVRNNLGPAGIALMDIDDFKICNDTYGHHAGDLALETVAKAIRSCIRETDLLIRYGGDEFLLVLSGIPADYLKTKLEQIRDAVQKAVVPGYPHFRLSLSIGGAMQTLADPMENVVRRADLLMYQAKNHKDAVAVDTQDSRLAAQEQVLEEKPTHPAGGRCHDEPHDADQHSGR